MKTNYPKQILLDRTKLLEKAGCSVSGITCNTFNASLLPELQAVTKVPFLPIQTIVCKTR